MEVLRSALPLFFPLRIVPSGRCLYQIFPKFALSHFLSRTGLVHTACTQFICRRVARTQGSIFVLVSYHPPAMQVIYITASAREFISAVSVFTYANMTFRPFGAL